MEIKNKIVKFNLFIVCLVLSGNVFALGKPSFRMPKTSAKFANSFPKVTSTNKGSFSIPKNVVKNPKINTARIYTKKAAYSGLGKKSEETGLIKTKVVNGHMKRTNRGVTYVNPYAKSK